MQLEILELGRTSFIGLFVIVGALVALRQIAGYRLDTWKNTAMSWPAALAMVVLAYGLGVFAENVSDLHFDHPSTGAWSQRLKVSAVLEKKSCSRRPEYPTYAWRWPMWVVRRLGSGAADRASTKTSCWYGPRPLATELRLRLRQLLSIDSPHAELINSVQRPFDATLGSLFDSVSPRDSVSLTFKEARHSITPLYFFAKSTTYRDPQYFGELREIEARSDFSRSFSTISLALALFCVCLALIRLVLFTGWVPRHITMVDVGRSASSRLVGNANVPRFFLPRFGMSFWWSAVLTCSFWILAHVAFLGYRSEETAFNERAFGYFVYAWNIVP